jgi:hypothetical protein
MGLFRLVLAAIAAISFSAIAAANNTDDGFIWIDANTRIKVKPVAVKPAPDAAAGATAPETAPKKDQKKATPKK